MQILPHPSVILMFLNVHLLTGPSIVCNFLFLYANVIVLLFVTIHARLC